VAPPTPLELPRTIAYGVCQERFRHNASHVFDYKLSENDAKVVQRLFKKFPNIEIGI
jgi:hypothetical protein